MPNNNDDNLNLVAPEYYKNLGLVTVTEEWHGSTRNLTGGRDLISGADMAAINKLGARTAYDAEFPQHKPLYQTSARLPRQIEPIDHFGPSYVVPSTYRVVDVSGAQERPYLARNGINPVYLIPGRDHFVNDQFVQTWTANGYNVPEGTEAKSIVSSTPFYTKNGEPALPFTGSTTHVNREMSKDKENVINFGLENAEFSRINGKQPGELTMSSYTGDKTKEYVPPPISPIHPFTRMSDPAMAQSILNHSYNRFQYPVADIEHRKSFRNLFFTRPECYIMCTDKSHNKWGLSKQCEADDEVASSVSRMPHIARMLSPVYVTGTFGTNYKYDNFNYLLSNRASGFSISEETLSVNETVTKGVEGYTIVPGMHMESQQGGSITVTFKDTKYLEIYEYFRLLMLYIYKRRRGIFEPPFAKYDYYNDFPVQFGRLTDADMGFWLHPYDRALEYTFSMFDIVTNEANDRIIYWCKYYGMYPTQVTINGLNNESGQPMVDQITVEVTFRYQRKLPCSNRSLIEFNFNAGITDLTGHVNVELNESTGYINDDTFTLTLDNSKDQIYGTVHNIPYAGGAGMFVGTPYIVMGRSIRDPGPNGPGDTTVHPFLRFSPVNSNMINNVGNLGIAKGQQLNGSMIPVSTD